jgi:tocopherol cyclase-like protein
MGSFTADGTENLMRWDRRSSGFAEVWYVTLNHRDTGIGLWFRYTVTAPRASGRDPYCELWGFAFDPDEKRTFGTRNRYPIDRLGTPQGRDDGAIIRIGDAWLSENHLDGEVEHDGRKLIWSLDFEPADRCFQHIPSRLRRRAERRASMLCSPNLDVPFTGSVTLDEEVLRIEAERGCQSHRWGRGNAQSWAWAHCANFEGGEDAVFEAVAAKSTFGPVSAPTLTFLYLRFEDQDIEFNDLRWVMRAQSRYEMPTWAFTAYNDDYKVAGAARSPVHRLVQVQYQDPDGSARYCANTEIADLGLELYRREGSHWRHVGSLTSLKGAHLEFGRRDPFVELPLQM